MTDGGSRGRITLGELIDAALAPAEPAAHDGFVADLAAVTRTPESIAAVAERFLAGGDRGRWTFLEWLARLRVRLPVTVLEHVPPLLADPTLPEELRVRIAARALRSARDQPDFLTRLVPPLTAGLPPLAALARLRAVQGRLRRSRALDRLIARRERRLRLACPRCPARLKQSELARHLHETHGLILHDGRARRPDRVAKELRKLYATRRDTTTLDQAAHLSDPAALRAWAARTGATPADLAPLAAQAASRGNGLCPRCLAGLPPAVVPLPPPLTVAGDRVSGEGYVVEVRGPDGLRAITVTTPAGVLRSGLDVRRLFGPRASGVLAAVIVIGLGIWFRAYPLGTVGVAALAYLAARFLRSPPPSAEARAIDRAWIDLVPRLASDPAGDRYIVRLCRASVGRGDVETRVDALAEAAHRDTDCGLTAAARYLQIDDAGRFGIDRVAAVADLISNGLRGDESLTFAEHVAELFLTGGQLVDSAERARLRVLVLEAAFAAGLKPRGLADLWAWCPRLRELCAVVPLSRLGLQYVVWTLAAARPWETSVAAGSVFELARVAPRLGGRLLAAHPDLLLYHRPPPEVDEALGWVLVSARGVVIGGKVIADPAAEVRVEGGRLIGAATLVVGPHRFRLPRRPSAEFATTLRALLRLRSELFLPRLDAALTSGPTPAALGPLARRCCCGANVLVAPGEIGRVVMEVG